VYYRTAAAFTDATLAGEGGVTPLTGATLASSIISIDAHNSPTEGIDPPLEYTVQTAIGNAADAVCVFWDYAHHAGAGGWSSAGCTTVAAADGANTVTCRCTHMTNFAVLTRVRTPGKVVGDVAVSVAADTDAAASTPSLDASELALDVITYAGVAFSVPCLLLMAVTFAWVRNLRTTNRIILGNLALTLALALTLFVFGVDATHLGETGCATIAVALHYLLLASFMWMLLDGWYLHRTFCRVFVHQASQFACKQAAQMPTLLICTRPLPGLHLAGELITVEACFLYVAKRLPGLPIIRGF